MKIYSIQNINNNKLNFTSKSQDFRRKMVVNLENDNISQTCRNNVQNLVERFADEGLTSAEAMKSVKRNPFMLVQKAETMERNIRETAKRFSSHGITAGSYLKSALTTPQLFSMSPDKVETNMKKHLQMFAYDRLSVEELFRMAQVYPTLYTLNSKTLNKKVDIMAKGIGAERFEIVGLLKKHPTVVSLAPKNFVKKFEFLKYIEENKFFDMGKPLPPYEELKSTVLRKSFSNSMEHNYLILLRNKLSSGLERGTKLPFDYLDKAIKEFIELNEKRTIDIKLPENKLAKEFTKFAKDFSKSVVGKNIFRIKFV